MLMNEKTELIIPGTAQRLVIGGNSNDNYGNDNGSLWLLTPSSEDDSRIDLPNFHIELIYGEKSPRLTLKGSGKNTTVMVTTRDKDGYKDSTKNVWRVY